MINPWARGVQLTEIMLVCFLCKGAFQRESPGLRKVTFEPGRIGESMSTQVCGGCFDKSV